MPQLLREIVVPDYPSKVRVAEKRRIKYYTRGGVIPKRYKNTALYSFDSKGRVIKTSTGELVIANRLAGQPRDWVVNFQGIWNGALAKAARANYVNKLTDIFRPYIQNIRAIKAGYYPIRLEIFIFDTSMDIDVSNKGVIYTKIIEDLLVREGKITDDTSEYINDTGRVKFVKVDTEEEKRMEIRIYSSSNTWY